MVSSGDTNIYQYLDGFSRISTRLVRYGSLWDFPIPLSPLESTTYRDSELTRERDSLQHALVVVSVGLGVLFRCLSLFSYNIYIIIYIKYIYK